jgi:hypothetical protein
LSFFAGTAFALRFRLLFEKLYIFPCCIDIIFCYSTSGSGTEPILKQFSLISFSYTVMHSFFFVEEITAREAPAMVLLLIYIEKEHKKKTVQRHNPESTEGKNGNYYLYS